MMYKMASPLVLLVSLMLLAPASWAGSFRVVATTSTLGMLAEEIGGDLVQVKVLAAPDRDAHSLDARPSFMAAVRRADLLLEMGAGLEEGWLPAVTGNAANPAINSGQPGHFRAANMLDLRPSITVEGPNSGHVHEEGNPHFNIDPHRVALLARALGQRLGGFFPEQAMQLRARAAAVARELNHHAAALADKVEPGQQFIIYHEDLDYLAEWLPVESVAYLEPIPGLPPTASHLRGLVSEFSGQPGRVLYANYQPSRGARFLQERLGWPEFALPLEPPVGAGLEGYKNLMTQWASAFDWR